MRFFKNRLTKNSIDLQKAIATSCIRSLRDIKIDSTLCGGAPRDWALNKQVADLDIYACIDVKHNSFPTMERLVQTTLETEVGCKYVKGNVRYDGFCESLALSEQITIAIMNFQYNNQKIQLMLGTKPYEKEALISRFSCSVCEYYWDESTDTIFTSELNNKHLANQSVLVNLANKNSYHVTKMKAKFPELSFNAFPYHKIGRVSKFVPVL